MTLSTKNSAGADKPRDAFKVTKHGTIRYVRYGFLLVCYSNIVPKTMFQRQCFNVPKNMFQVFNSKNAVTFKSGSEVTQGH